MSSFTEPLNRVYIGIGSNIDPHRAIVAGLDQLATLFGPLDLSPFYLSEAIGFVGPPFINLVAGFNTRSSVAEIAKSLRAVEQLHGKKSPIPKFSSRSLDLDLLLYGDQCIDTKEVMLPRIDIVQYAYVLWPLSDIAAEEIHPRLNISFRELRERLSFAQQLQRIDFLTMKVAAK